MRASLSSAAARVRVVDDQPATAVVTAITYLGAPVQDRPELERELSGAHLRVVWADAGATIADLLRSGLPILIDFARGAAALHVIRELRSVRPDALLFGVVDAERPDLVIEAVLAGMMDIFSRPLNGRQVADAVRRASGDRRGALVSDELYCFSPAMRDVRAQVVRAASLRAGVLVRGEDGSGRQMVARAIHASDATRTGQFVVVDCALSGDQLGNEMFGVAPRAEDDLPARGLERISRGSRVHDALGGTLYVQNIGEMPTRVQARLARILRDREVVLLETGETMTVDLRCVVSGTLTIEAEVGDGRVRDDLYRRVSVTRIDVPSLRKRREDVPAIANYVLRQICASKELQAKSFSRSAVSLLCALPWRGQVNELRRLLETVASGPLGRGVGLDELLAHIRLDADSVMFFDGGTLRQARARFEHEYIKTVLDQHRGRISEAAKALGIQRTNLYRKMRSLSVSRVRPR